MRRHGQSESVSLCIAVLHAMAIKGAVFTLAEIAEIAEIAEVSPQAISQVIS